MKRIAIALALTLAAAPALRAADAWFVSPDAGLGIFGPVTFKAHVETTEVVESVEFFVDGRSIGLVTAEPWELLYDVGYENQEHRLRLVATLATGERVEATRETASFKVDDELDIELRQLYVNVMSEGRRVTDLGRERFRIFDGGNAETIVTFEHGDIPMTAVLLLDCSGSMEGDRLDAALSGASTFLSRMAPLDEAKLMLFSDRLLGSTPFTRDQTVLEQALSSVAADGGTAINDYLFASLKMLDGRQGRRVIVLFTDGADLHSLLRMRDVLWKAQRSQAVLYWIYLKEPGESGQPSFNTSWRDHEENQEEYKLLRRAVTESGGHIAELESIRDLEGAFGEIIDELRNQYVLGYYPQNSRRDGSWRDVDVRVRRLGARVRTRQGYIDD